jgi:hypothetical protein
VAFEKHVPRHCAVLFCALWVVGAFAIDAPPSDAELTRIIQGNFVGYIRASGTVLGIDEATILNPSLDAERSAVSRAKAFAAQRLLAYSLREIQWPPHLGSEVVVGLSSSFLRVHQFNLDFQGLQLMKSARRSENTVRVIVSLPEAEKQIPVISLKELEKELRAALTSSPGKVDLASYLEFCAELEIPKVVDLLAERMGQYGKGTAATVAGAKLESPSEFQTTSPQDAGQGMPTTSAEGLKLLGARPYDPAVCLALGRAMQKSGHPRMAQLIYSRGAMVFVGRAEAAECKRKSAQHGWPLSFSYPQPELPSGFVVKLWKTDGANANELPPACRLIAESAGHLPVQCSAVRNASFDEAWRQFSASPPDLTNALQLAMQSLEEAFTADAANLAGRIYMLQGKSGLAVPFLEQARFLEPQHPYAQGNLALALYAAGENQIAAKIAIQAIDSPRTPDNLKKSLKKFIRQ